MLNEGHIIEFLDGVELKTAYVRKQDRDRLRVIDSKGRNLNVNPEHVIVSHGECPESDFSARAREIGERVSEKTREVDLELLWQALDGQQSDFDAAQLAQAFFGQTDSCSVSAVYRAVAEDPLHFRRKGRHFVPRTAEQVTVETTRREREREREAFRHQVRSSFHRLLGNKNEPIPADFGPVLDRLHAWMRYRTGDDLAELLEEIAGAAHTRQAAYDLLLRAGRVDAQRDRFLVMAGIEEAFEASLLEAAHQVAPFAFDADNRVDLRDVPALAIDDDDTVEVDDAISVDEDGTETVIRVHIADVSSFVNPDGALDAEARRRCSTIYLPAVTVPMFPAAISSGVASLVAGGERPAFTVEARFDAEINLVSYRILRAAIRATERMTYEAADDVLENGQASVEWSTRLARLRFVADRLRARRAERGAIVFRRPELKIRVDGDSIRIKRINPNSPSRQIVSEMMILVNGLAADFAAANGLPIIYRTQEAREATVEALPAPHEAIAFDRLRRTFKRSRLSLKPGLHSGLGLSAYTQVSSPIRRYADLITQRQFVAKLRGEALPYDPAELLRILAAAEAAESEIRSIEDRSSNFWLFEYLRRECMSAPLSAVILDEKGTFELEDYHLRGKAHPTKPLTPGTNIRVAIESVDPAKAEIRFKLLE